MPDQMPPDFEAAPVAEPRVMSSRLGRVVFTALGFLCLGLGIAGYVLPVLPGTVFILLAVWFFFQSNARMYHWVLNHPRLGPTVRAYRAGYGIRRRIKVIAIAMLVVSVAFSVVFAIESMGMRVSLIALGAIGVAFILTRPTTERVLAG